MTDRNDPGPESAESVIARARNAEPPVMALPGQQPDDGEQDTWMEAAFTALSASDLFDPEVLAAVELMMNDSESVTVSARQRLVEGAGRGVRWRRRLGNLLREHRRARHLTPGDIAARIGAAAPLIAEIETGAKPACSLTAEQVAAWIRYVGLEHGAALAALRITRPRGKAPEQDAGQPSGGFTCDVAAALGRSSGRC